MAASNTTGRTHHHLRQTDSNSPTTIGKTHRVSRRHTHHTRQVEGIITGHHKTGEAAVQHRHHSSSVPRAAETTAQTRSTDADQDAGSVVATDATVETMKTEEATRTQTSRHRRLHHRRTHRETETGIRRWATDSGVRPHEKLGTCARHATRRNVATTQHKPVTHGASQLELNGWW